MSCQSCGGKPEEHPNQFCEEYTTELPYERRPKYDDEHAVCCCPRGQGVPTNGKVMVKTEMGFSMEKNMFWCRRCGLTLTFAQMDNYGETWEQITERSNLKNARFLKRRMDGGDPEDGNKKEGLFNPLD